MKKAIGLIGIVCMIFSCGSTKNINEDIIWVNSAKVPCQGVAPMSCLQTQKGERINPDNWEYFYDVIHGFDYQPGTIYKLKVTIEKLDPATIPADASSLKYSLLEILEKKADVLTRIHDVWNLSHLQGEEIQLANEKQRPTLDLRVNQNSISGKGGCNNYSGSIKLLTKDQLVFNEGIISTRMACRNIKIENDYFKALKETASYKLENNSLRLIDNSGKEVLRFKKID